MRKKRGQFFIIASLIIIFAVSSILIYQNKILTEKSQNEIFPLKDQISEESSFVIDYGLSNNNEKIKDFLSELSSELISTNPSIELIFLFGNNTHINILNLAKENISISISGVNYLVIPLRHTASIFLGDGGVSFNVNLNSEEVKEKILIVPRTREGNIDLKIDDVDYKIKLEKYKNFYFIIKKEVGEEINVQIQ